MGTRINRNSIILISSVFVISLFILAHRAIAVPTDPVGADSLTVQSTTRLNESQYNPPSVEAEAGNVTNITLTGVGTTQSWQGYYGDITGTITLDDANNNTLYDWQDAEPQGEIYASINTSITWTTVYCFNYTDSNGQPNLTSVESDYNIAADDVDGVDETFNTTTHDAFDIGTNNIATDTCRSTRMYINDSYQDTEFQNMLMTAPDENGLVFTTIIENSITGNDTDNYCFNGLPCDFQMLVLEDGHNGTGQDATTTYYFWVEIE